MPRQLVNPEEQGKLITRTSGVMNSSTSSAFTVNLFIKITGVTFSSICVKSFTFSSVSMSLFEPLLLCPDVIWGDSLPMLGPT
ncbi:MAG: hypothetical protein WA395_01215 [Nitrososphaeraceae archaeon]